jgi:hypothetical protein
LEPVGRRFVSIFFAGLENIDDVAAENAIVKKAVTSVVIFFVFIRKL